MRIIFTKTISMNKKQNSCFHQIFRKEDEWRKGNRIFKYKIEKFLNVFDKTKNFQPIEGFIKIHLGWYSHPLIDILLVRIILLIRIRKGEPRQISTPRPPSNGPPEREIFMKVELIYIYIRGRTDRLFLSCF